MPEPWEFEPENQDIDFIDVSEASTTVIENPEETKETQPFLNDVHLSEFVPKEKLNVQNSGERSQSIQKTVNENPTNGESTARPTPYFHPNSQVKLYHKQHGTAAVIRLGKTRNDLITVVIDLCFNHTGNPDDWQGQPSVAFGVDELLEAFHLLKADNNNYMQTLKFHSQHKNSLNLCCNCDSIIIDTTSSQKRLYLKGLIGHKIKFLAMVESAINHYFATAFPLVEKNIIERL